MRSLIIGIPLLALAAVLHATILNQIRFLGGGFDLLLVLTMAWHLQSKEGDAPIWAFFGGLCRDSLSGGPFGAGMIGMVSVSLLISATEGRFYRPNWLIALLISILGTILYHLIYLVMIWLFGYPVQWENALTLVTLPSTLLNMALMMPTFRAMRWLHESFYPPKVE